MVYYVKAIKMIMKILSTGYNNYHLPDEEKWSEINDCNFYVNPYNENPSPKYSTQKLSKKNLNKSNSVFTK